MPLRRMEFRITQKQFDALLERHEVFGVPIARQIRDAITEYLQRHPRRLASRRSKNDSSKRSVHHRD